MSETIIVLLLIVPIALVIFMLNNSNHKRKTRERTKIHEYIAGAIKQTGVENNYQQQLIFQTIIIDEQNKKLLVIDHKEVPFSHEVLSLEQIRDTRVISDKYSFKSDDKMRRQESVTTRIGVSLLPERSGTESILTLYDHIEHNIYQMPDFEKAAQQLKARIDNIRSNKPTVV